MDGAWIDAANTLSEISVRTPSFVSGQGSLSDGLILRQPSRPQVVLVHETDCQNDEVGALIAASQHPSGILPIVVRSTNG